MVVIGLAIAAFLYLVANNIVAAIPMTALALFMGYWTSPLRQGQHTTFSEAIAQRSPEHAVILWAPGDPLSARLQTAVRGNRPDVTWVNVYRDAEAEGFLECSGGRGAIPLVIVGDEIIRRATVGQYLDARAEVPARSGSTDS